MRCTRYMLAWLALLNFASTCMNTSVFILLAFVHYPFIADGFWKENFKWTAGLFVWPLLTEFITSWCLVEHGDYVWTLILLLLGWCVNFVCWYCQIQLSEEYDTSLYYQETLIRAAYARVAIWVVRTIGIYAWLLVYM